MGCSCSSPSHPRVASTHMFKDECSEKQDLSARSTTPSEEQVDAKVEKKRGDKAKKSRSPLSSPLSSTCSPKESDSNDSKAKKKSKKKKAVGREKSSSSIPPADPGLPESCRRSSKGSEEDLFPPSFENLDDIADETPLPSWDSSVWIHEATLPPSSLFPPLPPLEPRVGEYLGRDPEPVELKLPPCSERAMRLSEEALAWHSRVREVRSRFRELGSARSVVGRGSLFTIDEKRRYSREKHLRVPPSASFPGYAADTNGKKVFSVDEEQTASSKYKATRQGWVSWRATNAKDLKIPDEK